MAPQSPPRVDDIVHNSSLQTLQTFYSFYNSKEDKNVAGNTVPFEFLILNLLRYACSRMNKPIGILIDRITTRLEGLWVVGSATRNSWRSSKKRFFVCKKLDLEKRMEIVKLNDLFESGQVMIKKFFISSMFRHDSTKGVNSSLATNERHTPVPWRISFIFRFIPKQEFDDPRTHFSNRII